MSQTESQWQSINQCSHCLWHAVNELNGGMSGYCVYRRDQHLSICPKCGEETSRRVGRYIYITPTPGIVARLLGHRTPVAGIVEWKPKTPPAAGKGAELPDQSDDSVLQWLAARWGGTNVDFAMFVVKTGGRGSAGDLREFVRERLEIEAAASKTP